MQKVLKSLCLSLLVSLMVISVSAIAVDLPDGSKSKPLRVVMIPTDTGASDVVLDYKPVFDAITKKYGIHFEVRAGSSYAATVQAICNNKADIAWFGAVTFGEARKLCGAELLAVDVKKGASVYYSGIFTRKDKHFKSLKDLRGKSLAVGSTLSTSSFNYPVAMIINAGVDPAKDLGKVVIAGSHSSSIAALKEGRVDAAAASFNSWEKAVKKGIIDPKKFHVLAKSEPIPNPPLAMNTNLNKPLKEKLKKAFNNIHKFVAKGKIRGYGGKKVDRYDANYPVKKMLGALDKLSKVTKEVRAEIVAKAGKR